MKTPSDTGNSPIGFCPGSDEDFTRKKCTIGMVVEGSIQSARYKKESKSGLVKPGKCTDSSYFTWVIGLGKIKWKRFFHLKQNIYVSNQGSLILYPVPRNIFKGGRVLSGIFFVIVVNN